MSENIDYRKLTIFVKNLCFRITNEELYHAFVVFGAILHCKVACKDRRRRFSKGFGFITYEQEESVKEACSKMNGETLGGLVICVQRYKTKEELALEVPHSFFNVYINGFGEDFNDFQLWSCFSRFGDINSAVVMRDDAGRSKGFGFVSFYDSEAARLACAHPTMCYLHHQLFVTRAQKAAERRAEIKQRYANMQSEWSKLVNLFVKNLPMEVDDAILKSWFEKFGEISSAKVMLDDEGHSRCFGFVCFYKPEDAERAIAEMNDSWCAFNHKKLYVSIAQRKDERFANLAFEFMHRRSSVPPALPSTQYRLRSRTPSPRRITSLPPSPPPSPADEEMAAKLYTAVQSMCGSTLAGQITDILAAREHDVPSMLEDLSILKKKVNDCVVKLRGL